MDTVKIYIALFIFTLTFYPCNVIAAGAALSGGALQVKSPTVQPVLAPAVATPIAPPSAPPMAVQTPALAPSAAPPMAVQAPTLAPSAAPPMAVQAPALAPSAAPPMAVQAPTLAPSAAPPVAVKPPTLAPGTQIPTQAPQAASPTSTPTSIIIIDSRVKSTPQTTPGLATQPGTLAPQQKLGEITEPGGKNIDPGSGRLSGIGAGPKVGTDIPGASGGVAGMSGLGPGIVDRRGQYIPPVLGTQGFTDLLGSRLGDKGKDSLANFMNSVGLMTKDQMGSRDSMNPMTGPTKTETQGAWSMTYEANDYSNSKGQQSGSETIIGTDSKTGMTILEHTTYSGDKSTTTFTAVNKDGKVVAQETVEGNTGGTPPPPPPPPDDPPPPPPPPDDTTSKPGGPPRDAPATMPNPEDGGYTRGGSYTPDPRSPMGQKLKPPGSSLRDPIEPQSEKGQRTMPANNTLGGKVLTDGEVTGAGSSSTAVPTNIVDPKQTLVNPGSAEGPTLKPIDPTLKPQIKGRGGSPGGTPEGSGVQPQ